MSVAGGQQAGKSPQPARVHGLRGFLRDHGLTIVLMVAFLVTLVGMMLAGWSTENQELSRHGEPPLALGEYVVSGGFLSALFENWESEFLQMSFYVVLTAYLFQRGSAESLDPDDPEKDDEPHEGWHGASPLLLWLWSHSLGIALALLFIASFVLHWLSSAAAANEEAIRHRAEPTPVLTYLADPQFWFESFQNWQSEFLSTAVLVVLSIFLRYKGSPESKSLSQKDHETGA